MGNLGIVSDVSTKYFLQIWTGAQAVLKLRPDFIAGQWAPWILRRNDMIQDAPLWSNIENKDDSLYFSIKYMS